MLEAAGMAKRDMVEIAADAGERIVRKQEGKRRRVQRANRKSAKGR
jgi:hypothetical protein